MTTAVTMLFASVSSSSAPVAPPARPPPAMSVAQPVCTSLDTKTCANFNKVLRKPRLAHTQTHLQTLFSSSSRNRSLTRPQPPKRDDSASTSSEDPDLFVKDSKDDLDGAAAGDDTDKNGASGKKDPSKAIMVRSRKMIMHATSVPQLGAGDGRPYPVECKKLLLYVHTCIPYRYYANCLPGLILSSRSSSAIATSSAH